MTIDESTSAFKRWQAVERELHAVETQISQGARERDRGRGGHVEADLRMRAQRLRAEVEQLFPSAMQELEEGVRSLKDKRPRLHQR